MHTFVVYDVVEDRVRKKIADVCLDYGLRRVQYSGFCGDLGVNHREEMILKLRQRFGKAEGCIHIIPLCQRDEAQVVLVGKVLGERQRQAVGQGDNRGG